MNQKGKPLAVSGLVLQVGALIGLVITLIGLNRIYSTPATSELVTPPELANQISEVLYPTAVGALLGLIGAVLILVALFRSRYRAPWFRTMLWVLSIIWLFSFPVGTIVGVIVIVYLRKHNDEFTGATMGGRRPA